MNISTRLAASVMLSQVVGCFVEPTGTAEDTESTEQAATVTRRASLIFDDGFESGNLDAFKLHATAGAKIDIVTAPVSVGPHAARFDLINDPKASTYRAELQLAHNDPSFEFNKEYWFGLNYNLTDWEVDSDAEVAPFQIHRVPSQWGSPGHNACGGERSAYSVAPFLMFSKGGIQSIITKGGVTSWSGPIVRNRWQSIVFHFKITFDRSGFVEAWRDGTKLFRREGSLHDGPNDECGRPWRNPTFNVGVYKWNWAAGRPATQSSRRTLVIDAIKIARGGADGFALVAPPQSR